MARYIFITGGVVSSLGKGLASAALGALLQARGFSVRLRKLVTLVLQFAEKNPGMTRVMAGDALVFENERLQERMNQFFDKIEATLKQSLRGSAELSGSATPSVDVQVRASVLTAFVVGRLQRFARSGFRRLPSEFLDASLAQML